MGRSEIFTERVSDLRRAIFEPRRFFPFSRDRRTTRDCLRHELVVSNRIPRK